MILLSSLRTFVRSHRWKILLATIALLPVVGIAGYAFTPRTPSYVTEDARRGDLRQIVDAVGTVISERDLQLQFPLSGIVATVSVREGDTVRAGQRLATLRAGNLAADVSAAVARVQAAEAELRAREQGARAEDVAVSEAELLSRQASLATARTALQTARETQVQSQRRIVALAEEAETALSGQVISAGSTVTAQATASLNALSSIRSVLRKNEVTDAVIRQENFEYQRILSSLTEAESALNALLSGGAPAASAGAIARLEEARRAVQSSIDVANRTFTLMDALAQTTYLTEAMRDAHKSVIAADRSALQAALATLDGAVRGMRDASAAYETRLVAERANLSAAEGAMQRAESDIAAFEAAVQIAQAQLDLRRAPARQTDIDAARANLRQARASLQRTQADLANMVLTAPIAGRITRVHIKTGEAAPMGPAMTLLGESPFRVEMYVSEIDIPKVQAGQEATVKLDAYGDTRFALRVTDIDVAPTVRDGVNRYRVRLDFVYPHDELKIGMTGDVEIVTGGAEDVVMIPVRAVLLRADGTSYVRILKPDGTTEERPVETGLEGESGLVEVDGVEEEETIIVLERS